jgi:hypothetical protein
MMEAAKHGDVKGMDPGMASEFLGHQSPKGLPEKKKGKRKPKSDVGKMPAATRPDGSKRKGW